MIRLLALLFALFASPAAAGPCRLALALGLDVSGSVDAGEYRLQVEGLAGALEAPDVVAALLVSGAAPVRLAAFAWSGPGDRHGVAGWREISDRAALAAFAAELRAASRSPAAPATALGAALMSGARLLAGQPDCQRRVLDISGDGRSNTGPRPQSLGPLDALAGGPVTVNALAIGPGPGGTPAELDALRRYFETAVIRGPGAFVEQAAGYAGFARAMRRKLLRELKAQVVGDAGGRIPPARPCRCPDATPVRAWRQDLVSAQ